MIELTRLNDTRFYLNPDHLWLAEATPDTVLTMHDGERLVVKESPAEVARLFKTYKQAIHNHTLEV